MIKFIKNNKLALLFVLAVNLSELTYLIKIPWLEIDSYMYTLGELLYYFVCQIGYLSLIPSIALYKVSKNNIDSRGIYLGLIVWNCFEVLQEVNLLARLGIEVIQKNNMLNTTILQIIFINFTVILMYIGNKKCTT